MAIIINPDGTVSTIETTHDQYGNLRPKIDSGVMQEQEIHYSKNTISDSSKKGYVYPTSSISGEDTGRSPIFIKRAIFRTTSQIDKFFSKMLLSHKWLGTNAFIRIKNTLNKALQDYFAAKYQNYREQFRELDVPLTRATFKKPKVKNIKKEKNKNNPRSKEVKVHHNSHAGHTIGDIATFGTLKEKYASSQDFDVRTSNPPRPARAPKYAYARDRYGRVQERDSFNEEKKNEFYVAQNRQRNYDYSSYDSNDDNDGAYSDWE